MRHVWRPVFQFDMSVSINVLRALGKASPPRKEFFKVSWPQQPRRAPILWVRRSSRLPAVAGWVCRKSAS
jgi:hypothetical protein